MGGARLAEPVEYAVLASEWVGRCSLQVCEGSGQTEWSLHNPGLSISEGGGERASDQYLRLMTEWVTLTVRVRDD